jgi:hypothetical protein
LIHSGSGSPEVFLDVTKIPKLLAPWEAELEKGISVFSAISLLFLLILAHPAFAAKHPVPLDKGVTQEKCLDATPVSPKAKAFMRPYRWAVSPAILSAVRAKVRGLF